MSRSRTDTFDTLALCWRRLRRGRGRAIEVLLQNTIERAREVFPATWDASKQLRTVFHPTTELSSTGLPRPRRADFPVRVLQPEALREICGKSLSGKPKSRPIQTPPCIRSPPDLLSSALS